MADAAPPDTPPPPDAAALASASATLRAVALHPALLASSACRELRKSLAPLLSHLQSTMFGATGDAAAYADKQARIKRAAAERNKQALEDKRHLAKTQLRAGRMQRLALLATQGDGSAEALPLVLDGVADEGFVPSLDAPGAAAIMSAAGGHHAVMMIEGDGRHAEGDGATQPPASDAAAAAAAPAAAAAAPTPALLHEPRACYTCKARFRELHSFYDTLCPGCAALNWRKRNQSVDLTGRIALVTGARVKIGFHCALKLLRAGASVIATSRFPRDTACRFAAQPDASVWSSRVHVYGLDLRDLQGLETFCDLLLTTYPRLDVIVNNACQTVRRPTSYYAHLMPRERAPFAALEAGDAAMLARDEARWEEVGGRGGSSSTMRRPIAALCDEEAAEAAGGASAPPIAITAMSAASILSSQHAQHHHHHSAAPPPTCATPSHLFSSAELSQVPIAPDDAPTALVASASSFPPSLRDVNAQQLDLRHHNSWLSTLEHVSTPELAEVMSINAMAPFILVSRLKPLLLRGRGGGSVVRGGEREVGATGGAASLSLAEAIMRQRQQEQGQEQGGSGASSTSRAAGASPPPAPPHQVRGKAVGGANKRPRRETGGGTGILGDAPSHRIPAAECRFVINVSSMEGKFYRAKLATHPHTNMAKAALNMMTRTSAGSYAEECIYMNAVDTGWINEENPLPRAAATAARHNFATPLDEVDAAARILDPMFAPLIDASERGDGLAAPTYGAFLKDYFATEW